LPAPLHGEAIPGLAPGAKVTLKQVMLAAVESGGTAPIAETIVSRWFTPGWAAEHPDVVADAIGQVAMTPDEVVRVDAEGAKTRVRSGVREFDRKNATASFGIAVDKLQMLSGRPTQIHEVREERAGLKDLALRLLQGGPAA